MLRPAAMRKLRMIVLERDARRITQTLGELGVVHLQSSMQEGAGRLLPGALEGEITRCRGLLDRLDVLMERMQVDRERLPSAAAAPAVTVEQAGELVKSLEEQLSGRWEELAKAQQGLADVDELLRGLSPYRDLRGPLRPLAESEFLAVRAGSVKAGAFARMRAAMPGGVLVIPLAEPEEGRPVEMLVLGGRRRRFAIETVLDQHGFEQRSLSSWQDRTPADVYQEALETKRSLGARIAHLQAELRGIGEGRAQALRETWRALSIQLRLSEAAQNFGTTWATAVVSGWVPADKADELRGAVMQATGGQAVVEIREPDTEDIEQGRVPSYVVHSRFFAPFERLVRGYGVASYTEIEPTVLFAASFLLMFGIIFGDLGHGLCLLAIGLLVRRLGKSAPVRDVGGVIAASSVASMLFGTFFQGSFFGRSLRAAGFPLTLGFEPIRLGGEGGEAGGHVVRYLLLAMALGIVLISLGAVLNIVNRLRRGDYGEGLLGRFGLVGIIFYWGALGLAVKVVVAGVGATDVWVAVAALGLPLVVLVLHEPLHALLTRGRPIWRESPLLGFFEGLIEALETVMLYVANTFSFLRVAAFALSHAALCFTVFVLERLVNGLPGGFIWSAAVFVIGTAIIIGLEGLIVAIQIMRLEYYEFFTKFFAGEGIRYEPFRLE